jgi:hypothetical protein
MNFLPPGFQSSQSLSDLIREENVAPEICRRERQKRKYHAKLLKRGKGRHRQQASSPLISQSCRNAVLLGKKSLHRNCHKIKCPCVCHTED